MGFTQPCFIRKISHELCDKLTELGYKDCWTDGIHSEELKTITYVGNQCWCLTGFEPKNSIDCGTNEELFLALAALKDDTNENQWFIAQRTMWDENYNGEITVYYEENEWLMYGYYSLMEEIPSDFRKATVEEIIKHFKDERCTKNTIK